MSDAAFNSYVAAAQSHIESVLGDLLPQHDTHTRRLTDAMRYSVLGGGKRLRALLVYATGEALGSARPALDAAAAAVEMIHAYSLIHDDLPAMDDDDLRRGRPSCHRAFDEGTAILAGDALQAMAFEVLARGSVGAPDAARIQMLTLLARAIGTEGMAGGQAIDLEAVRSGAAAVDIELMHRRKTGALIAASVELGAIASGVVTGARYEALREYGAEIGLAFQIQDDILDVTGDTGTLGKKQGADAALGKPTYPSIFGLDGARAAAGRHRDRALQALKGIQQQAGLLNDLALFIVARAH